MIYIPSQFLLSCSSYYIRAVLYRRLHPFIFSLHTSQYNHPASNNSALCEIYFWVRSRTILFFHGLNTEDKSLSPCFKVILATIQWFPFLYCYLVQHNPRRSTLVGSDINPRYLSNSGIKIKSRQSWQTTEPTKRRKNIGHLRFLSYTPPPYFYYTKNKRTKI